MVRLKPDPTFDKSRMVRLKPDPMFDKSRMARLTTFAKAPVVKKPEPYVQMAGQREDKRSIAADKCNMAADAKVAGNLKIGLISMI